MPDGVLLETSFSLHFLNDNDPLFKNADGYFRYFNLEHSKKAGEFARIIFQARKTGQIDFTNRILIPNDTKLFAQVDVEMNINAFVTSDTESIKAYNILKEKTAVRFELIDITKPYTETYGLLDL